jgi:tetratricopeptide (TPR) repeat protein
MIALALALVLVGLVAPAAVEAQSVREQALARLRSGDVVARRAAVQQLADSAVMADLPALAAALRDADPIVRGFVESAMWSVWSRSGDAVETFTRVIERRPDFAEGWNKRATVYFMLGDHQRSLADCDEVMARNPFHWGALSGYGMIYMQLDQPARAIDYLEKALAVNPNLDQVAQTLEALKSMLLQRRRDMI